MAMLKERAFVWSLTGVCALVGFMLTVQLSSHVKPQPTPGTLASYLDLRSEIQAQQEENRLLTDQIAKARAQIAQYEAAQNNQGDLEAALRRDEQQTAAAAGLTPVTGPGIEIKIQDDPLLTPVGSAAQDFQDRADVWISEVINDLFANGATAISINDQRLVTTSSIRWIKGLNTLPELQVNTVPVTQPYIIRAVGDVDHMTAELTLKDWQANFNIMQEDFIVTVHRGKDGVTVPAYHGPLPGKWAKEATSK
jgi:uncharacterized protein YlxW (UPF0749 family)